MKLAIVVIDTHMSPMAVMVPLNNLLLMEAWYLDSGATHHVTLDAYNLMNVVSLPGSDQVHLGNGQGQVSSKVLLRGTLGSDGLYKYDNLVKPPPQALNVSSHPTQCLKSSNSA
ncbi:hypothetical protein KIW84_020322 [Lathyrus oleraceus]|uniref:Uncharacterized protein n=1 Tax=Pisum sativum TaxID=3888 RepID=A0A9D4Y717_PEA|nr:hypothetical protein KIW84_020322 [Pisum sativum]